MWKNVYFIVIILFMITGCDNKSNYKYDDINVDDTVEIDDYVDNNPIKLGLYQGNKLIRSYNTTLGNFKELGVFNVYYTDKEILDSSNIKHNYLKYAANYENVGNYKTGFYITFEVGERTVEQLVLDPTSKHYMAPYMYVYLYDDVNQAPGSFYSHLEPEDMRENTIISSIKLFFPHEGTSITSPITLTVFTYDDEDDFTADKHYRGKSSYTIKIYPN